MLHSIYFSPSGTTEKISGIIAGEFGGECAFHDITLDTLPEMVPGGDDLTLLAVPVYAGRVPALAAERLAGLKGNGSRAIVAVVYGNRDYDDALLELCDIAKGAGFDVVAAGAFIAEHCIFPKVAAHRPDAADAERIAGFVSQVRNALDSGRSLDIETVKGNRPYKKPAGVPLHPEADKDLCNDCGTCAGQCPVQAIDPENLRVTDGSKCIACCRCINVCPQKARRFGGVLYKMAGWKFVRDNARRLEPEWFV